MKILKIKLLVVFLAIAMVSFGFLEGDKSGKLSKTTKVYKENKTNTSGKNGDALRMSINNLDIPINNYGTLGDVNIGTLGAGGFFGGKKFLFSGGFMMTGYTNGKLWGCAQATASLIENFLPGPVGKNNDPNAVLYVLRRDDEPFGQSWQDWKDAVALGADFYDGDGDGIYNPVDKNGNGVWDPDEDCPDLLGDQTVWCVYNDGKLASQRLRFVGVDPQGIEMKQTVFGFESKGALGNIMFVRYRIKNIGTAADTLKNVLFAVWADPDLGDFSDDLVGVDTLRNAGFTYNDGPDPVYGSNPPCFMIDYFSGPQSYIPGVTYTDVNGNGKYDDGVDIALDTAYSNRGQIKGVVKYPGAKNLGVSSFVHYQQSDPVLGDPNDEREARNYMNGLNKLGQVLDPCTFTLGSVRGGVNCALVDPKFWYSGDPVTNVGWINNRPTDQRQMTNVGPIDLIKDQEVEITVAYVVGQGADALNSITAARAIDDGAQFIFDHNFAAPNTPPAVKPVVETGENFIDLTWETSKQVGFVDSTSAWNDKFEGFNVYAYRTYSTVSTVGNGEINAKLLTSYDLQDTIKDVYKEDLNTGGKYLLYPQSSNPIDYKLYSDPTTGRIRLRITKDPFTGGDLIKGKPYYFAITTYALNHYGLVRKNPADLPGSVGDVYLSGRAFVGEVENVPVIINHNGNNGIIMGEDLYNPPAPVLNSNHISGTASGIVGYDIVNKDKFLPGNFTVSFFKDKSSQLYSNFWRLKDQAGTVLLDSQKVMSYDSASIAQNTINGFVVRVQNTTAVIDSPYAYSGSRWYKGTSYTRGTGVFYVGKDLPQTTEVTEFTNTPNKILSNVTTADQLRKVKIIFGTPGKAYRYLNGFIGTPASLSYKYAAAVTATDTTGKGIVGKLGEGFVDVPFTAWVDDPVHGDKHQLAVAFIERRRTSSFNRANPDGVWDPSDSLRGSGEVIAILNAPYDATGSQKEYTGGTFTLSNGTTKTVWADLVKKVSTNSTLPDSGVVGMTPEQLKTFNSPWLNAMYIVGLEKQTPASNYTDGDTLTISLKSYPYTDQDVYKIEAGSILSDDQKKGLFDRVNVFPNPLFAFNPGTSYNNGNADEPFVTFSNLPEEITIKIFSLSGNLLRTLTTADKPSTTSPFLKWNLQNESGLRVASGMYLAIVSSPKYGEKILKFAIIMPQKQIQKY